LVGVVVGAKTVTEQQQQQQQQQQPPSSRRSKKRRRQQQPQFWFQIRWYTRLTAAEALDGVGVGVGADVAAVAEANQFDAVIAAAAAAAAEAATADRPATEETVCQSVEHMSQQEVEACLLGTGGVDGCAHPWSTLRGRVCACSWCLLCTGEQLSGAPRTTKSTALDLSGVPVFALPDVCDRR
jgi:hypothetical protein